MELLHGEELDGTIDRVGSLSPLKTAAYFAQIAAGLQLAHDAGVVHRDLSTNNIFLARNADGGIVPKILDFGVSKTLGPVFEGQSVTCDGAVLGNPIFMSPEQARGAREVDARTDIWALGVGMYQALTGKAPFRSTNYNALMVDIMTHRHRPIRELIPTLDQELSRVIEDCLIKDRNQRLASAQVLAERLSNIARRLATDPAELGSTPRRRATDLLLPPRTPTEGMAETGVPLGIRMLRALGLSVPSRLGIAVTALALGGAAGFSAARVMQRPAPVVIQAAPPVAAVPRTTPRVETPAPASEPAPATLSQREAPGTLNQRDTGLTNAVSNGLRAESDRR
jgi:serine/threonine-protein kinase